MKKYLLIFYFIRVCLLESVIDENPFVEIEAEDILDNHEGAMINGTFYQTVKSYYCRIANTLNQELLVYGSKAWRFPLQDVNLTLQYPPKNSMMNENTDYSITELKVMLYIEGSNSRGYITRGGLLHNNISMTFIMGNTTRLSYQFWLYGVPRASQTATENYNTAHHQLC